MAANPLTYTEIETFARLNLIHLRAWDIDLICRLDDAVLATWAGQISKPKGKGAEPDGGIPVDNRGGIRDLFRGLKAQKEAAAKVGGKKP